MKLSEKDKKALVIGGIALVFFCLIQFVFFPLADKRSRLVKSIAAKQKQLAEMQAMAGDYDRLGSAENDLVEVLEKRSPDFSLFSFLEKNAAASNVKDKINYMRPSELEQNGMFKQSLVDMKLNGISLNQLVSFLEKIESTENLVGISRLSVQKNSKQDGMLDVILQIVSIDGLLNQQQ